MKGLLPWLREALFGPKPSPPPRCAHTLPPFHAEHCKSGPNPNCGAGYCSLHHKDHCLIAYGGRATCADGRAEVFDADGRRIA